MFVVEGGHLHYVGEKDKNHLGWLYIVSKSSIDWSRSLMMSLTYGGTVFYHN